MKQVIQNIKEVAKEIIYKILDNNSETEIKKYCLIDFDGCQMNTEPLAVPSLIARFNMLYNDKIPNNTSDEPLTFEIFKENFHGQARENLCENLSKYFKVEVDYPLLYKDREWSVMEYYRQKGVEMAPNIIETLTTLQNEGFKFAFVSNNPSQRGLAAMRYATNGEGDKLAKFFATNYFEAGDTQKPKPDVYLTAMKQLGISTENCIIFAIEDSITGVKSAVAAGILTFGFTGFSSDPAKTARELVEAGALEIIDDWDKLPGEIEKICVKPLGESN